MNALLFFGAGILALVLVAFSAAVSVWQTLAWTLLWMNLVKRQKIEKVASNKNAVTEPLIGL